MTNTARLPIIRSDRELVIESDKILRISLVETRHGDRTFNSISFAIEERKENSRLTLCKFKTDGFRTAVSIIDEKTADFYEKGRPFLKFTVYNLVGISVNDGIARIVLFDYKTFNIVNSMDIPARVYSDWVRELIEFEKAIP